MEQPPPPQPAPSFASFLSRSVVGLSEPLPSSAADDDVKAGGSGSDDDDATRAGIYNFLQVPFNLEPLLLLGYVTCLDCFLQLVTFLPLRVLGALLRALRGHRLTRNQSRHVVRFVLVLSVSSVLLKVDMSHAYHSVRNQATLKLYVIFNVLEIFDKLCGSFGQDILDALDASASALPRGDQWGKRKLTLDFAIALVYTVLHTMVLFYHAVALNIALNSHNNLLITLLISNNFVELKSNVFKRIERENLFQVACSDVVERFQLSVYLSLVALQFVFVQKVEATAAEWGELGFSFGMIVVSECTVDWIKHAFVIKFNRISPAVYAAFVRVICTDACRQSGMGVVGGASIRDGRGGDSGGNHAAPAAAHPADAAADRPPKPPAKPGHVMFSPRVPRGDTGSESDFSALPAARMGFGPLPLLCLVIRIVGHDVAPRLYFGHASGWALAALVWVALCLLKVLTSIVVLGVACAKSAEPPRKEDEQIAAYLSGIQRYSLHGKAVV